jgi:hypothetical protein
MSFWAAIIGEAGINLVLNPSAEDAGNFANHNSATVTRVTKHARWGLYCYLVTTGAVNRGINLTMQALANAIHYVTFYVRKDTTAITGTLEVSLNGGTNYNAAAIISGALADSNARWIRYGVQIAASQANGSTALIIRNTVNENFYVDAVQVEQQSYYTTYMDGDRGPLYRWNGLRNGSTSTRDAQERWGGREHDLVDDFGIYVSPDSDGIGMPDIALNFFEQALQPGALFQSEKIGLRMLNLKTTLQGTTYQNLQQKRQDFIDIVKGNAKRGRQPVLLRYTGANVGKPVYAPFRYADGLKFGPPKGFVEEPTARLIAEDPFWREDDNQVTALTMQQSISTAAYGLRRVNGLWQGFGSGFNNPVFVVAVDKARNRVFYGGQFTTANGVTVNRICYWNGTTFVALGSGTVGVSGGDVRSIAIAPNGDVWVGGDFTAAGGTTTHGIARWNSGANTWTVFALGAGAVFRSLGMSSTGVLYAAGNFTNWNGDAAQDYITSYNGTSWVAMGTSPFSANNYPQGSYGIAVDAQGNVYVGSQSTLVGVAGNLWVWNGSTWTALATSDANVGRGVALVRLAETGRILAAGSFSTLGGVTAASVAWVAPNGTVTPLGSGLGATGLVYSGEFIAGEAFVMGGIFEDANAPITNEKLVYWNGSAWSRMDISLPDDIVLPLDTIVTSIAQGQDLYIGYQTNITALAAARTTLAPISTTEVYPVLYLIGPTSGNLTLHWLENQSSGDRLYFNLTVNAGETITIDLRPGRRQVTSNWRGVIRDQPLSGSDFANFELLPDANVLAAFATGTLTGAELLLHQQPTHLSVDGVA